MYRPSHFDAPAEAGLALLRRQVLGTVVWQQQGALEATPLPWWVDPAGRCLQAHLPRANPLVAALEAGPLAALVIVQGPSAYVSPSWYPSKAETERMVPTWNYATVHLHGRLQRHDDPAWVRRQMAALTAQQEGLQPQPWSLDDAAPGHVDQLLRVLTGIELAVERIETKFKLGQNRSPRDQAGLMAGLRAAGDPASLALLALTEQVLGA